MSAAGGTELVSVGADATASPGKNPVNGAALPGIQYFEGSPLSSKLNRPSVPERAKFTGFAAKMSIPTLLMCFNKD